MSKSALALRPSVSRFNKPVVKLRPIRAIDEDFTYQCVLCKKHFADAEGFKSHHLHAFTKLARCLDKDELRALCFVERRNGVWARDITTQTLPSHIARLATIRPEIDLLGRG